MRSLGLGLGLRPAHIHDILTTLPRLGFFEIISENFIHQEGIPFENLEKVMQNYPVVMHGVSLSIGSADELNGNYLRLLKRLAETTKSPWFSDHLCFSSVKGEYLHDLLPLPYSRAVAHYIIPRIKQVQDYIGLPFALENISSYLSYKESDMTEWDFYNYIVEKSGCHMLLDVNNIYVSSVNHGFNPMSYLDGLDLTRVIQIHLAGHSELADGSLLDTHDHPVKNQVWQLYRHVRQKTGDVSVSLEWDDHFLSLNATLQELQKASELFPFA